MDNSLKSRYNLLKGGDSMNDVMKNINVMFESPINIIQEMDRGIETEIKNGALTIARKYGIDIDEKALVKALKADRARYEEAYRKGYAQGYSDAQRRDADDQDDIDDLEE